MGVPPDLAAAVKQQAANDTILQEALLMGSYGESSWTNANLFGFTTYGTGEIGAPAAQQVATILPSYQQARSQLPAGLTGAPAAEWVALMAEGPAFSRPANIQAYGISTAGYPAYETQTIGKSTYTWLNPPVEGVSQAEAIAATGQTTQYGAASAETGLVMQSIWPQITSALGAPSSPGTSSPSNNGSTPPKSGPAPGGGNYGTYPGAPGPGAYNEQYIPPATTKSNEQFTGIAGTLSSIMTPKLTFADTTKVHHSAWSWNPITDAENVWDDATGIVTDIPNEIDRLGVNIYKIIIAALARTGVVVLGLGLLIFGLWVAFPQQTEMAVKSIISSVGAGAAAA